MSEFASVSNTFDTFDTFDVSTLKNSLKNITSSLNLTNLPEYTKLNPTIILNCIGKYTFGLDKVIPWENNNFVFSGGLLYDIITERFDENLMDIDLFFYGSEDAKINTFKQILRNLETHNYKYLVGIVKSVVYVFIQGIPRIIQLIFTSCTSPEEIINNFDLTHIQSYWDGHDYFAKTKSISDIMTHQTNSTRDENEFKIKPYRLIKYLERNVNAEKILYDDYNFILNIEEYYGLAKYRAQKKFYSETKNLTMVQKHNHNLNNNIKDNFEYISSNDFEDDFRGNLEGKFWCKITTINKIKDLLESMVEIDGIDNKWLKKNIDTLNIIDLMGDLSEYTKLNLNGNFDPVPSSVELEDDILEGETQGFNFSMLKYQTQKYIYVPCQIIRKNTSKFDSKIHELYFEFTKPRVIDYLMGLSNDFEMDIEEFTNPKNEPEHDYTFTHHFVNTTLYPNIKPDSKFKIDTCGLVMRMRTQKELYEQVKLGDKVYVLFSISGYNFDRGRGHNMFGFKLKPCFIENQKL